MIDSPSLSSPLSTPPTHIICNRFKDLILALHNGADPAAVKERFTALFASISAVEISQLEQELIEEGLPAEDIKELCDVHLAVFREGLEGEASPEMTPGHPVHTFKYENFAVSELQSLLDEAVAGLPDEEALAAVFLRPLTPSPRACYSRCASWLARACKSAYP